MILSNESIEKAVKEQTLKIEPFDRQSLGPMSIDLHLNDTILQQIRKGIIDPYKQETMDCFRSVKITKENPFVLNPGACILGETMEKLGFSFKLGGYIGGKSTIGRLFLRVENAPWIEPGHGWPTPRPITLELTNIGVNPVLLYPYMPITKLLLVQIDSSPSYLYDDVGRYSDGQMIPQALVQRRDCKACHTH